MRKRYSLQEHLVKAPMSVSQEDLEPSRNQIANPGAVQLRRTRSLIQDLNSGQLVSVDYDQVIMFTCLHTL